MIKLPGDLNELCCSYNINDAYVEEIKEFIDCIQENSSYFILESQHIEPNYKTVDNIMLSKCTSEFIGVYNNISLCYNEICTYINNSINDFGIKIDLPKKDITPYLHVACTDLSSKLHIYIYKEPVYKRNIYTQYNELIFKIVNFNQYCCNLNREKDVQLISK